MSKKYVGLLFALFAANASASVVTYQFQAKINTMYERELATMITTDVTSSNMAGTTISKSDSVTGWFSYDTNASLSSWVPDPAAPDSWVDYNGGAHLEMTFSPSGLSYQSNPDPWLSSIGMANNDPVLSGFDMFSVATTSSNEYARASVTLFDPTGKIFNGISIPSQLNLSDFPSTYAYYTFSRPGSGTSLEVSASLTSLTLVPSRNAVPEPDSMLLSVVGLASLGVAGYRRKGRRVPQ